MLRCPPAPAALVAAVALAGCMQDTGFQSGTDDTVTGSNGTLVVTPTYVLFDGLTPGWASSASFEVASTGEAALEIYQARLVANPGGVFTFEERDDTVVNVGDSQSWSVALYVDAEGKYEGSIRIDSNDGESPQTFITLCGATTGYADPCPETLDGGDTGGGDTGDSG
jgi:hypothetical protein